MRTVMLVTKLMKKIKDDDATKWPETDHGGATGSGSPGRAL